jgi:HSP20 family protein
MRKDLFPAIRKTMLDKWFDDIFDRDIMEFASFDRYPKIDMKETDKEIIINAEIPGVDKKDINIDLNENILTISFERKQEKDEKDEGWRIIERSYGKFSRTITLPCIVKSNEAKATYKDGVLKIVLPKEKDSKSNKIKID